MVEPIGVRGVGSGLTQEVSRTQDTQKTTDVKQTQGLTGVGTEETDDRQSTSIPQNDPPRVTQQTMEKCFDSIVKALSSGKDIPITDLVLQVQQLTDAISREQMKTQQTGIKGIQDSFQKNVTEQVKKIEEAKAKMEEQKTWDTFKDIFTYAALAVGVIAAVATGGILAVGVAVLGAAFSIAQKTGAMDKLYDSMGMSQEARMAVNIVISVALIAASITNTAMIAKGVGEGATRALLPRAFEALGMIGKGVDALKNVTLGVQMVGTIAGGLLKIGEGINQIGRTVAGKELDDINNQGKELQIQSVDLKQQQQALVEAIKELLKLLDDSVQSTTQVLQTQSQTMQRLTQRMS